MKFFRAEDTVSFHLGAILELTDEQAKVRMMGKTLRHISGKRYEVVKPIQFKRGEVIGIEGEIPKAMAPKFNAIDEKKKKE
jgi:hypothetical protein